MRRTIFHNVKECFDILVKISQWEKLQIELRRTEQQKDKSCIDKLKEKVSDAKRDKSYQILPCVQ